MSLADIIEENRNKEWAELNAHSPVKYTGKKCTKCGRERVELLVNGKRVCGKCNWDQDNNEYLGGRI